MPLGDNAKAALPLRSATLKQQAMITRQSGERQVSLKPALNLILEQWTTPQKICQNPFLNCAQRLAKSTLWEK